MYSRIDRIAGSFSEEFAQRFSRRSFLHGCSEKLFAMFGASSSDSARVPNDKYHFTPDGNKLERIDWTKVFAFRRFFGRKGG